MEQHKRRTSIDIPFNISFPRVLKLICLIESTLLPCDGDKFARLLAAASTASFESLPAAISVTLFERWTSSTPSFPPCGRKSPWAHASKAQSKTKMDVPGKKSRQLHLVN
jgi:hypothetical protein